MPALGHSWIALTGLCFASALCGYGLRRLLCVQAARAGTRRISTLCDQLDLKDDKLQGLRAELHAAQAQLRDLQAALAARPVSSASADGAAVPFRFQPKTFKPHGRVPAAEPPVSRHAG